MIPPDLIELLRHGPNAEQSLSNANHILSRTAPTEANIKWPSAPQQLQDLAQLLSAGPEPTQWLVHRVTAWPWLWAQSRQPIIPLNHLRDELRKRFAAAQVGKDAPSTAWMPVLAEFRTDHYLRLSAAEFRSEDLHHVCRALSDVHDIFFEAALQRVCDEHIQRIGIPQTTIGTRTDMVIFAMGKYGAQELNFCSDVDLVFIYETDDGQAGTQSLHEFFSSVCRQLTQITTDTSLPGPKLRIDLRLRPEGRSGPLCNSVNSTERYYETWGGPYDRLAWLKARPIAGAMSVGESISKILHPFVFPRAAQPSIIADIHRLSAQIRQENRTKQLQPGWNVKLEHGGIRDVEFFVQALQLIHGGQHRQLQPPQTLPALAKLHQLGFITAQEQQQLSAAYIFLRRVEHRLQLHGGRQTHFLPHTGQLREEIAAHLGYTAPAFDSVLHGHQQAVIKIYASLGTTETVAVDPLWWATPDGARDMLLNELQQAAFSHPEHALDLLLELRQKPYGPFATNAPQKLRQTLWQAIITSAAPDNVLRHFSTLCLRYGQFTGLWQGLIDDPRMLHQLCALFAVSDYFSQLLISHPQLLDQLWAWGDVGAIRTIDEFKAELTLRCNKAGDYESQLTAMRQFHHEELIRIALFDLCEALTFREANTQLSDIAQVCLQHAFHLVYEQMTTRYGRPVTAAGRDSKMTILAVGKLGGRELTYESDLDLLFVFDEDGETTGPQIITNGEFFARLSQRLINALSAEMATGKLFSVDTRLRPSGNQGTLVVSLNAFAVYQETHAAWWEKMVLVKSRPVAGDLNFGQHVSQYIRKILCSDTMDDTALRQQIRHYRQRLQDEVSCESEIEFDPKAGHGGLLDIEFIVAYLQLMAPKTNLQRASVTIPIPNTEEALSFLIEQGDLSVQQGETCLRGYQFLRRLECRLRLLYGRSRVRLPKAPGQSNTVAKSLGYHNKRDADAARQLLDDYADQTQAIRQSFIQIITQ